MTFYKHSYNLGVSMIFFWSGIPHMCVFRSKQNYLTYTIMSKSGLWRRKCFESREKSRIRKPNTRYNDVELAPRYKRTMTM